MKWINVKIYGCNFLVVVTQITAEGIHGPYICVNSGRKFRSEGLFVWKAIEHLDVL